MRRRTLALVLLDLVATAAARPAAAFPDKPLELTVLPGSASFPVSLALVFVAARLMGLPGWWRPALLSVGVTAASRLVFVDWPACRYRDRAARGADTAERAGLPGRYRPRHRRRRAARAGPGGRDGPRASADRQAGPTSGLIMLAGVYYGSMYGGSTTSILINVPGEAASVVTTIDGYRPARRGAPAPRWRSRR